MSESDLDQYNEQSAGSPNAGEPVFLVVGKLRKPHGVRGEMIMEVLTDFPERLAVGCTLYVGKDYHPLQVRSLRWHNTMMLVAFQGMTSPEAVGEWRNAWVFVPAEDIPSLEDGEYYHHQLLGLAAITEEAERLGLVTDILETGSNDVLVVQPASGAEILLPFTDEVIQEINLEEGIIHVRMLPGLLP